MLGSDHFFSKYLYINILYILSGKISYVSEARSPGIVLFRKEG